MKTFKNLLIGTITALALILIAGNTFAQTNKTKAEAQVEVVQKTNKVKGQKAKLTSEMPSSKTFIFATWEHYCKTIKKVKFEDASLVGYNETFHNSKIIKSVVVEEMKHEIVEQGEGYGRDQNPLE